MKTRGVLIENDPRGLTVGELDLPELGPDDVLVQSRVVGVCRSDIELLEGHLDAQLPIPYPVVLGHEWSGEVVEVGRSVRNVTPGDPVVGECVLGPNHWFGFTLNGAASDAFVAPAGLLHRLPSSLSYEQGALVEPFTIAYRAIRSSGGCDGSDVVAVVGSGMIGLCALSVARANGSTVVVIEPSASRRELALSLRADIVLDPSAEEDVGAALREATGSEGADLVIEASGNPRGLASTFELVRFGGRVTNIGICAQPEVSAPLGLIQAKDLLVRGTTGSPGVWPSALRFIERHELDLTPVISRTFSFAQADDALRAAEDTAANLKVHLKP